MRTTNGYAGVHRAAVLGVCLLGLGACSNDEGKETAASAVPCQNGEFVLQDSQNYSYSGDLTLPVIETATATDIEVCWNNTVQDIQCHDFNRKDDVDNVSLIRFPNYSQSDVEQGLSNNNLLQADISGYVAVTNEGGTCANLADMSFFGTPIDIAEEYNEAGGTYLLNLTTGTIPGIGSRMIAFLQPSATSDVTSIELPDGCGILDFEATVQDSDTLNMCTDGGWTIDWSGLTKDGLGNEVNIQNIDSVMVGFYEGLSAADIQSQFLDLELIATQLYTMPLDGQVTADLTLASDGTNNFASFDGDGTWIVALRCSTCSNPAPLFLSIVEPG
jgi:hypothetical protein